MSRLRPALPWFRLAPVITAVPNFSDHETPTGTINGVNADFTLANTPSPTASLMVVLNGLVQERGVGRDYTISGLTITFSTAPPTGSRILVWYRY